MPFQSCFTKDSGSWENSIKPNRPFFLVSKCFSLLAPSAAGGVNSNDHERHEEHEV
jgi:hypothetical protein